MPTKKLLASLPPPSILKTRMRALAMLDAILAPDVRSFEFHPRWAKGEVVGAYKDGSGNELFVWFSKEGAVLRGFHHELPATKPADAWHGLPPKLGAAREEVAFGNEVTFAAWAKGNDGDWTAGRAPSKDGSVGLLAPFRPSFGKWAADAYEVDLDSAALNRLWNGAPLDRMTIAKLNPDYDEKAIKKEAKVLGWKLDFSGAAPLPRQKSLPLGKTPPPKAKKSFGEAEFVVRVHGDEVKMLIHQSEVVARAGVDVYGEIFDWVKARLKKAHRSGV